jgi:hypothetical protein
VDCFAEPVIGRAFARPVARNDGLEMLRPGCLKSEISGHLPVKPASVGSTRHSGMRLLAQARNPYSRSWLWIPGSSLRDAPE